MYSTRAASGSRPLIPPDSALPPPASVLPPPASVLVPPDSPFLHRRIPDSRFIVAPRAPHITIQFLQGKGSLDLFSLDLPLPASCESASVQGSPLQTHKGRSEGGDRAFVNLMKTGQPETYIPSPSTISRDVKFVFAKTRERVAKLLREHDGALNFITDAWTSPNHRSFVAFSVAFEVNGEEMILLLDFIEVAKSHTGLHLAAVFASMLKELGIADKILSVTCDNASPNIVMIDRLQELVEAFPGQANLTRCFNHVLSLVAKTVVRQFDVVKDKEDEAQDNAEKALQELAAGTDLEDLEMQVEELRAQLGGESVGAEDDDLEDWEDERELLSHVEREALDENTRPIKLVLVKLRKISFALIHSSTILLPRWRELLESLKISVRKMPRDVKTRWNSTYDMLCFALEYRKAIDTMAADKDNGLRKFELDVREWQLAEQLCEVLAVFKDATLFFSRATPNLATVIPAMDHIDEVLTTASLNTRTFEPAIRAALSLAKKTLNRYTGCKGQYSSKK
ncbi:hypothetical protein LshimejAT787_2000540 [Lyophyllum shimeji]|uniref:Transposase n=1 Tax=Lyophyllum shimeji TaxID=47721 RepID=A0A9P3Q144_LYOSH|nr:hypothetical protein LshimejAT787_2000540 [Lyophyllum shimeji]